MMESLHESEPPLFLLPLHLRPQRLLLLPLRLLLSELQLLSLFLRRSHLLLALLLDLSHRLLHDAQMARKDSEMINVQSTQLLYGRGRRRLSQILTCSLAKPRACSTCLARASRISTSFLACSSFILRK